MIFISSQLFISISPITKVSLEDWFLKNSITKIDYSPSNSQNSSTTFTMSYISVKLFAQFFALFLFLRITYYINMCVCTKICIRKSVTAFIRKYYSND